MRLIASFQNVRAGRGATVLIRELSDAVCKTYLAACIFSRYSVIVDLLEKRAALTI